MNQLFEEIGKEIFFSPKLESKRKKVKDWEQRSPFRSEVGSLSIDPKIFCRAQIVRLFIPVSRLKDVLGLTTLKCQRRHAIFWNAYPQRVSSTFRSVSLAHYHNQPARSDLAGVVKVSALKTVHMRNNIPALYKKAILAYYACTDARRLTLHALYRVRLGDHWVNVREPQKPDVGTHLAFWANTKMYKLIHSYIRECFSLFSKPRVWEYLFETLYWNVRWKCRALYKPLCVA